MIGRTCMRSPLVSHKDLRRRRRDVKESEGGGESVTKSEGRGRGKHHRRGLSLSQY